jgi:hypothetical protein
VSGFAVAFVCGAIVAIVAIALRLYSWAVSD